MNKELAANTTLSHYGVVSYEVLGNEKLGRELADQMLGFDENADDLALLLVPHGSMGDTLHWLGEFKEARHGQLPDNLLASKPDAVD